VHTHAFYDYLVSEGALRSSIVYCHHAMRLVQSMVKSNADNDMEAKFRGLATMVRVLVAMKNLLGDS
jgi:hypothetical protein